MLKIPSPRMLFFEIIFSGVTLLTIMIYTSVFFFRIPYAGFQYDVDDGRIVELFVTPDSEADLQQGDQLMKIGSVRWDEFAADPQQPLFNDVQTHSVVMLEIRRDDQTLSIPWEFPGPTTVEIVQRINSQWWLAYAFWLAGVATLLLVRPKDARWHLLIAFNFLTALWLGAGSVSQWHIWRSVFVLNGTIWLCVPVYLHLHWIFPRPMGKVPAPIVWLVYLGGSAMILVEWLQIAPRRLYQNGLLIALAGSLILLLFRIIRRPAQRREVGLLAAAMGLPFVPLIIIIGFTAVFDAPLPFFAQGGAVLGLVTIPGAYFFTIYRPQFRQLIPRAHRLFSLYLLFVLLSAILIITFSFVVDSADISDSTTLPGVIIILSTIVVTIMGLTPFLSLPALAGAYRVARHPIGEWLEFRANRALVPFLFFVLLGLGMTIPIITAAVWLNFPGGIVTLGLMITLLVGGITVAGYTRFQRFIEHRVLGIPLPPTRLLETYTARIATSPDRESLVHLLTNELFPSLSIRQSALLALEDMQDMVTVCSSGVTEEGLPALEDISQFLIQSGSHHFSYSAERASPSWVRLALPLNYGGKPMGLWLLGRRDPDDSYSQAEIPTFQALADQTAIALTNIIQREKLHLLYQQIMDQHEEDMSRLSRVLHDDILAQLSALGMYVGKEQIAPQFRQTYQELTRQLRHTIRGLHPAMLHHGLGRALDELVDNLVDQHANLVDIQLDVPSTDCRYPKSVELHLFRIIQQATQNALQHAQAQTIRIYGTPEAQKVTLTVEDDGIGFEAGDQLRMENLLKHNHFGLIGMYDRAQIIGASLHVRSAIGQGTQVSIIWQTHD